MVETPRPNAGLRSIVGVALVSALPLAALGAVGCEKHAAARVTDGRQLFASVCSRCHGEDGQGGLPLWDGGPSPRNFHDSAFHRTHSDAELRKIITGGKGEGMPAFGATFDEAQLTALVSHLRTFDPERPR